VSSRVIVILLALVPYLWGAKLEYISISSVVFKGDSPSYVISAKSYINNIQAKDKMKFLFNQKAYMLKYNFYKDGLFKTIHASIHFLKAYILGPKIHFVGVTGKVANLTIKAKELIYDYNSFTLISCEVRSQNSIIRRKKYIITP
jgi:hypothetical protein